MKTVYLIAVSTVLAALLIIPVRGETPEAQVSEDVISDVIVDLRLTGRLPVPLKDRISESILKVGERALVGKTISDAETLKASLSQVMKKIFSEVLSGFRVLDLTMNLDSVAVISVHLECKTPGIEEVVLEIVAQEGIHPRWKALFEEKLSGVRKELEEELLGIPVESTQWSEPLIESIINEKMGGRESLTGFELVSTIKIGRELKVRTNVKPSSPTIRLAAVKIRSATIPSLALERIKFDMARHTDFLLGIPVEFAAENEDFIIEQYRTLLSENSFARKLRLDFQMRILFENHTLVRVIAESEKYKGFARVKVSLGKSDRNPDVEGHLGIYMIKDTEVFSEFNFLPGPIDLQFNLGVGRRFGNLNVATGRNVIDGLNRIWVNYHPTEDIIISWEKNVVEREDEDIEGSVTFRAHDFFSIEMITDFHTDFWLRFVANM